LFERVFELDDVLDELSFRKLSKLFNALEESEVLSVVSESSASPSREASTNAAIKVSSKLGSALLCVPEELFVADVVVDSRDNNSLVWHGKGLIKSEK